MPRVLALQYDSYRHRASGIAFTPTVAVVNGRRVAVGEAIVPDDAMHYFTDPVNFRVEPRAPDVDAVPAPAVVLIPAPASDPAPVTARAPRRKP